MSESTNKLPKGFWAIGIIALIWNLMGVYSYLQQAYMTDEAMAALPQAQQEIMQATPAWVTAAFALAVFGGTLGSILLLMRKKLAVPVFGISLGSIIAQMGYGLGIAKSYEVFGAQAFILPIILIVIGVFLYMYSKKQREAGVLV